MNLSAIVEGFCYRNERRLERPKTAGRFPSPGEKYGFSLNTEPSLHCPAYEVIEAQNGQRYSGKDQIITHTEGKVSTTQWQSSSSCHETIACARGTTETMENCESTLTMSGPYRTRIFYYLAQLYGSEKTFSHLEESQKVELVKCLALSKISSNRHPLCEICFHRFQKRSDLSRNLCSHFNVRPYTCSICGRRFVQKGSANVHMKTHAHQIFRQKIRNAIGRH